ncbi:MAG: GntR family transcriptional regulator [Alphaproteobacteria bacterium]
MPTVADQIFALIVSDILSGMLRPKDAISERSLVARFGASRTPIREALKRLHERGFLTSGPKGISVIRDMPLEDVEKLYSLRIRLERAAAMLTAKQIDRAEIARLDEINKRFAAAVARRDLLQMLEIRAEFHSTVAAATRNRWLAEILTDLRDKAYAVRHWHWQESSRAEDTVRLHDAMIRALRERDGALYRRLVEEQIRAALDVYADRLVARPADEAPGRRLLARRRGAKSRSKAI